MKQSKRIALVSALSVAMVGIALINTTTAGADAKELASPAPVVLATLNLRITAYSSSVEETDSTPFITANGTYVHDGIVATNLLPFGTKVEIPSLFGDKVFTVEDRMARRYKATVDIWMPTKNKASFFGVKYADVVVVDDDPNLLSIAK